MRTVVSSPSSLLLVPWTKRSTLLPAPVCRSRSFVQCSPRPSAFSPRTPPVVGRFFLVVHPCSFASSILRLRPTSGHRACRDDGLGLPRPDRPWMAVGRSPDLPVSVHGACVHALVLRLRGSGNVPCDSATSRAAFPVRQRGRQPERVISELNSPACTPPVNASPPPLTRGRRMTRGHGWSLAFTMWRTCTSRSMPAFTGAFCLSPSEVLFSIFWVSSS